LAFTGASGELKPFSRPAVGFQSPAHPSPSPL
jgi:hypothetical protein